MTYAPPPLKAARQLLVDNLDMHPGTGSYPADLDPGEVGIIGDTPHAVDGTSYHLGADQLRDDAYSARTVRDRAGLTDAASAVDVGEFEVTTPLGTFTHRDLALWSVAQCQANHPDTRDIREIIYSPDGVRVFRYDRERGITSKPAQRIPADNHRWHNHYSQYRDATKAGRTTLRDHFARWLTEIGVIDMQLTDKLPNGVTFGGAIQAIYDRTNYLANVLKLDARLAAIQAAAEDDGNTTVVLGPEALAEVRAIRADLAAVPQATADLVHDDLAD